MAQILFFSVVIFAVLYLFAWDIHALVHSPTTRRNDIYNEESSELSKVFSTDGEFNSPSIGRGIRPSAWSKEAKENLKRTNDESNSIKWQNKSFSSEAFASWDIRKLLQYVVSLLHAFSENKAVDTLDKSTDERDNETQNSTSNNIYSKGSSTLKRVKPERKATRIIDENYEDGIEDEIETDNTKFKIISEGKESESVDSDDEENYKYGENDEDGENDQSVENKYGENDEDDEDGEDGENDQSMENKYGENDEDDEDGENDQSVENKYDENDEDGENDQSMENKYGENYKDKRNDEGDENDQGYEDDQGYENDQYNGKEEDVDVDYETSDASKSNSRSQESEIVAIPKKKNCNNTNVSSKCLNKKTTNPQNHTKTHFLCSKSNNSDKIKSENVKSTNEEAPLTRFEITEGEFIDDYINHRREEDSKKANEQTSSTPEFVSDVSNAENAKISTLIIPNTINLEKDNENLTSTSFSNKNGNNQNSSPYQLQNDRHSINTEKNISEIPIYNENSKKVPLIQNPQMHLTQIEENSPQNDVTATNEPVLFDQKVTEKYKVKLEEVTPFPQITDLKFPFQIPQEKYNTYEKPATQNSENSKITEETFNNNESITKTKKLEAIGSPRLFSNSDIPLKNNEYINNDEYTDISRMIETQTQEVKREHDILHQNKLSNDEYDGNQDILNSSNKTNRYANHRIKLPVHTPIIEKMTVFDNNSSNLSSQKENINDDNNNYSSRLIPESQTSFNEKENYPPSAKKLPISNEKKILYNNMSPEYSKSDNLQTSLISNQENNQQSSSKHAENTLNELNEIVLQNQFDKIAKQNHITEVKQSDDLPFQNNLSGVEMLPENIPEEPLLEKKYNNNAPPFETKTGGSKTLPNQIVFNDIELNSSQNPLNNSGTLSHRALDNAEEFPIISQKKAHEPNTLNIIQNNTAIPAFTQTVIAPTNFDAESQVTALSNILEKMPQEDSDYDYDSDETDSSDESLSEDSKYEEESFESSSFSDDFVETTSNASPELASKPAFVKMENSTQSTAKGETESTNAESSNREEKFNTILEYLYKFSNNPLLTRINSQKNKTT